MFLRLLKQQNIIVIIIMTQRKATCAINSLACGSSCYIPIYHDNLPSVLGVLLIFISLPFNSLALCFKYVLYNNSSHATQSWLGLRPHLSSLRGTWITSSYCRNQVTQESDMCQNLSTWINVINLCRDIKQYYGAKYFIILESWLTNFLWFKIGQIFFVRIA